METTYKPGVSYITNEQRKRGAQRSWKGRGKPASTLDPFKCSPSLPASVATLDPYMGLAAGVLLAAIKDMQGVQIGSDDYRMTYWELVFRALNAYDWLMHDGPIYAEALGFEIDLREWVPIEFERVWGVSADMARQMVSKENDDR